MYVAGPRQDSLGQDEIHHPHDRPLRRLRLRNDQLFLFFLLVEHGDLGVGIAHALEDPLHHVLWAVQLVDTLCDHRRAGEEEAHLPSRSESEGLFTVEVEGVRRCDLQIGVRAPNGKDVILAGLRFRDQGLGCTLHLRQIRNFYSKPRGEGTQNLRVRGHIAQHGRLPQRRSGPLAPPEFLQLIFAEELPHGAGKPFIPKLGQSLTFSTCAAGSPLAHSR